MAEPGVLYPDQYPVGAVLRHAENSNIVTYEHPDHTILAAVCTEADEVRLRSQCSLTQQHCAKLFSATVTYCIMDPCPVQSSTGRWRRESSC